MEPRAIQDQLRQPGSSYCFGCGADNEKGLAIKSYWRDSEALCTFHPRPEHAAGPPHVLNGGILATVIDCHGVCTAIAAAYEAEGRPIGASPLIWYVTGSMSVDYRLPTPIDAPLELSARVTEVKGRKSRVEVDATSRGKEVARATVVAIRVASDWLAALTSGPGRD